MSIDDCYRGLASAIIGQAAVDYYMPATKKADRGIKADARLFIKGPRLDAYIRGFGLNINPAWFRKQVINHRKQRVHSFLDSKEET